MDYIEYPEGEMKRRSKAFYEDMQRRRTIRQFSDRPVPREIIENCLRTAGTAPSGANMQPWKFVVVEDLTLKKQIRQAAEKVEHEFYSRRAPDEWLHSLAPLGTSAQKPFLETAPYLIAIFSQLYGMGPDGEKIKHYYVLESVGIATGILISAIHNASLVSLTYTPSPMKFLNRILDRPANERPFMILVVGYPAKDVTVPDISRKMFDDIAMFK
ncbi:MAG: nitroreductase family protein [Deltaproteobacteria bacterium]|nr:nitroreductase family protein [Deltaproteobacteria bacterium]